MRGCPRDGCDPLLYGTRKVAHVKRRIKCQAEGRFNLFRPKRKLDCPIRGCLSRCLVRLDRHFQRIHGLKRSDPTYTTLRAEAKGSQAGASLVAAPEVAAASLGPPQAGASLVAAPEVAAASLGPPQAGASLVAAPEVAAASLGPPQAGASLVAAPEVAAASLGPPQAGASLVAAPEVAAASLGPPQAGASLVAAPEVAAASLGPPQAGASLVAAPEVAAASLGPPQAGASLVAAPEVAAASLGPPQAGASLVAAPEVAAASLGPPQAGASLVAAPEVAAASLGPPQAGASLVAAPEVAAASLGPPQAGASLVAAPEVAAASLGPLPGDSSDSDSESEEGHPSCGRSRRPTTPDSPCLRLYLQYLTGPKPTSKKRENSLQAVQHVRLFLGLMADVSPGEAFADNLTFLKDTERCQLWFSELLKLGWAPTTVHCYLTDVANFLHYLLEARLPGVCPRKKQLKALLFSLNAFRRAGRRELTQHRQKVAELGQQRLIPKMNLKRFDTHANELIPDLLRLAETGVRNGVSTLIGLICGKLMIHNGHRRGVLMNMTAGEVEVAKRHENQFHVRVYEHKTTVKYGAAVLVVSAREHGWLLRFSALRATLPGYNHQPGTFFFTSGGKPIANMGLLLSKAWRACGIGEWVTAGMIRSAVATYTWSTHGEVSKTTVSRHMTHSLQMQAAFYVLDGAPANHQQARRLIEQSLDICESDSPESPEMASA
ncbi:UNVERIFIED_CONTAM: hypothetical protein FKN15_043629 [Acipenser sinensis]